MGSHGKNSLDLFAQFITKRVKGKPSPMIDENIKREMNNCDKMLRKTRLFPTIPQAKSLNHGLSNYVYQESRICNFIPDSVKNFYYLNIFKSKIRTLNLKEICSCKLCNRL